MSEGAMCGLLESLGLREGVQSCLPLKLSSKPTVRGGPWGKDVPYVFFGVKIPHFLLSLNRGRPPTPFCSVQRIGGG